MINKRLIEQLKRTNEEVAKHFEAIGKISDEQYVELLSMIEKIKTEKKLEAAKVKNELSEIKRNAEKIKRSDKTTLKKKDKIDSSLSSISKSYEESSKKQKSLNKVTDQLIDKIDTTKKQSFSLLGAFQKKEITREFKLTFTDTSKIVAKNIIFKNSIIENVVLGKTEEEETTNYKEKKLKLLKSINKRFTMNFQIPEKIEPPKEKPEEGSSLGEKLGFGAGGIGAGALAKKFLPSMKTIGTVAKSGTAKLARFIPVVGGVIGTVVAIKSLIDRIPSSIKKYQEYESQGLHKAAIGQLGNGVVGGVGDVIGGLSSWIPGPLGWAGMGLGLLLSSFGDALGEASKNHLKDKTMFGVENKPGQEPITLEKIEEMKKKNRKEKEMYSQMQAISRLDKNNQKAFIAALDGKSKMFLLPKYEFDGEFIITPEELKLRGSTSDNSTSFSTLRPVVGMLDPEKDTVKRGTTNDFLGMLPSTSIVTSEYQKMRILKDASGRVIASRPHKGRDYGLKEGTPITATMSGVMSYENQAGGGFGKYIKLKTVDNYEIIFAHLSAYGADKNGKQGQVDIPVKAGQVIGYSGKTGLNVSSGHGDGAHLHVEVRNEKGEHIDPTAFEKIKKAKMNSNYNISKIDNMKPIDMSGEGYKYGKKVALYASTKLKGQK
jgi:murein DD-endopeptidase MepM/ murein hydrolase activator NlpD